MEGQDPRIGSLAGSLALCCAVQSDSRCNGRGRVVIVFKPKVFSYSSTLSDICVFSKENEMTVPASGDDYLNNCMRGKREA